MARAACDRYQGRATDGVFLRFHPGFHSLRDHSEGIAFFAAFLPQFVDPAASLPVWAQFLILGTIVNFAFSSADFVTVLGASAVVRRMKQTKAGFAFGRWIGGSLMIGLGVKLATDKG